MLHTQPQLHFQNPRFQIHIAITATNPNKNIAFNYNPTSISISCDNVDLGDGVISSFKHGKKNSTVLKVVVSSVKKVMDGDGVGKLKASLKSKSGLVLVVDMRMKVTAKMGRLKMLKVGIRVMYDGINAVTPSGKKAVTANLECKVDVRFKIWKWTVG